MRRARVVAMVFGILSGLPSVSAAWLIDTCASTTASTPSELTNRVGECMSSGEPSVRPSLLEADSREIATAYEVLAASHRRIGIAADLQRTLQAFASAWAELRWRDQDAALTSEVLFRAAGYGRLKVLSHPSGAGIYVNDKQWSETTDTTEWMSEGEKRVVLKKKRCKNAEGEVHVRAGEEVTFEKTLDCTR